MKNWQCAIPRKDQTLEIEKVTKLMENHNVKAIDFLESSNDRECLECSNLDDWKASKCYDEKLQTIKKCLNCQNLIIQKLRMFRIAFRK